MARYRRKVTVVEAEQWFPQDEDTDELPVAGACRERCLGSPSFEYYVCTIHGEKAHLKPGDWVVQEPDGVHYYPVKSDIFEETYELVEEEKR